MFDDKQKNAYSAVKAPDELRERVFSSAENRKDNILVFRTAFSRAIAAAACIVLVAAAVFTVFNGNGFEVSINGSSVSENTSVEIGRGGAARSVAEAEVSVKLELDGGAHITVDSGEFDVSGEEKGLTEFSAHDDVEIVWRSSGLQRSEMTVDYGRETCVLVLEYDGICWTVTRK